MGELLPLIFQASGFRRLLCDACVLIMQYRKRASVLTGDWDCVPRPLCENAGTMLAALTAPKL